MNTKKIFLFLLISSIMILSILPISLAIDTPSLPTMFTGMVIIDNQKVTSGTIHCFHEDGRDITQTPADLSEKQTGRYSVICLNDRGTAKFGIDRGNGIEMFPQNSEYASGSPRYMNLVMPSCNTECQNILKEDYAFYGECSNNPQSYYGLYGKYVYAREFQSVSAEKGYYFPTNVEPVREDGYIADGRTNELKMFLTSSQCEAWKYGDSYTEPVSKDCYALSTRNSCDVRFNTFFQCGSQEANAQSNLNPVQSYNTKEECNEARLQNADQMNCVDTDGGINKYQTGTVTTSSNPTGLTDRCRQYAGGTIKVLEYYCDEGGSIVSRGQDCDSSCVDGACIDPIPVDPITEEPLIIVQPFIPTPLSVEFYVAKMGVFIDGVINPSSIAPFSIIGGQIDAVTNEINYEIDIVTSSPDSDFQDGKYERQFSNWALVNADGNIIKKGSWSRSYGTYREVVSIPLSSETQNLALVGFTIEMDMQFEEPSGWEVINEGDIMVKEGINTKTKDVSVEQPSDEVLEREQETDEPIDVIIEDEQTVIGDVVDTITNGGNNYLPVLIVVLVALIIGGYFLLKKRR